MTVAASSSTTATTTVSSPHAEWLEELPVSALTITLYVPTISVGAVIGRKGVHISQLQQSAHQLKTTTPPPKVSVMGHSHHHSHHTTNTPVDAPIREGPPPTYAEQAAAGASLSAPTTTTLPHSNSAAVIPFTYTPLDWSDPSLTPVVIRADPIKALWLAERLLILATQKGATPSSTASMEINHDMLVAADCIVDVPMGRHLHSSLVGKKGIHLMQLSHKYHTRIMVPPKEFQQDWVQLEAPYLVHCIQCLQGMVQLLSNNSTATTMLEDSPKLSRANNNKRGNNSSWNGHSVTMVVAVLPGQTKLRSVARKTDTVIQKKKERGGGASSSSNQWQLTISGPSMTSVQQAQTMIVKWQQQQQSSSPSSPTSTNKTTTAEGSPSRGGGGRATRRSKGKRGGRGGRGDQGGQQPHGTSANNGNILSDSTDKPSSSTATAVPE